jgi:hypothetical protein
MDYAFPDVKQGCLLCGLPKCARWKGYYTRQVWCPVVGFDGLLAIHVGHCSRRGADFSYYPGFLIPFVD